MGKPPSDLAWPFLAGGGQLGALIARFDWSQTGVGPIESWPAHMRTATGFMLRSTVPIVMLWGEAGVMIYNDAYSGFAGGRHPRLLGSNVREGWPEVADFNDHVMRVGLAGGTLSYQDQELTLHRRGSGAGGEQVWMNLDYSPLVDDEGVPVGVVAVVVETTAKVRAERRLMGEHERIARLFELAPSFMAMVHGEQHVLELANPSFQRLVGERPLIGLPFAQALPEAVSQGYLALLDEVRCSGHAYTASGARYLVQQTADHPVRERFVDFVFQPVRDASGAVTDVFIEGVDVTERTLSDRSLRLTENRLRALNADLERQVEERSHERSLFWQRTSDLLGVLDSDAVFVKSNPAWQQVMGWTEEELHAMSLHDLVHPDEQAVHRQRLDLLTHGTPSVNFGGRYRTRDGQWRWLAWTAVPEEGRFYCSGRDVTAEREAEIQLGLAQEALRQAQKMEAVGQLTGGIAHDFNNLLGGISASLQVLESRIAKGRFEGASRYIAMGKEAVRRAASLTQRLLAFSRRQTLDPKAIDANRLIAEMEELIRRTMGPGVTVRVTGDRTLWPTRIDPSQLENSLLNLCINARDAMPDGGQLRIDTQNVALDAWEATQRNLAPGDYVMLAVADSGTGMSEDVIARAFDPFFTTKPIGQGTGLGLSMVYGFVRQSGGQIRIESQPGQGTCVRIFLPRHHGEITLAGDAPSTGENDALAQGHGECVLVVDDEENIRLLVVEALEDAGYQTLSAADGSVALRLLEARPRIDLLLTDVGLPGGMNGRQVADAARVLYPGLQVLFITGYAESSAIGSGQLEPGMAVLTKPFELRALVQRVRDMLAVEG